MYLFLLSYDLFLSSSFFSCFISVSVMDLPGEPELCCFPFSQAPAGVLLARSKGCRTVCRVLWEGWSPPKLQVRLRRGLGWTVPLSSQRGGHHKTTLGLTRRFPLFIASLWEGKGTQILQSHKGRDPLIFHLATTVILELADSQIWIKAKECYRKEAFCKAK